ncbi:hypothetical protein BVX97_01615 [bacterium E08(2017)]|nr:hypothetical protein BVX97_01615 [bacterium E08(2017)]
MSKANKTIVKCQDCGKLYQDGKWTKFVLVDSDEHLEYTDGFCRPCLYRNLFVLVTEPKRAAFTPA